jgi:hypothetical protein
MHYSKETKKQTNKDEGEEDKSTDPHTQIITMS